LVSEFNDEKKLLRINDWLILASYVVCLYGLIQAVDYYLFPLPAFPKGLDPFIWRQAFGYRIMGTFGNPNFFGDFLGVVNPLVLSLLMYKKNIHLVFLYILIALCVL
jgi:hypothetical protein